MRTTILLAITFIAIPAFASETAPPRRDPLPNHPAVELESQASKARAACKWIRDAEKRFWNRKSPPRFSVSLQELRDTDNEKDKISAELVAAERTLQKTQAFHEYQFKVIDVSENAVLTDYVVIAARVDYPTGGAESFLLDSNGNMYSKDLGAEPWVSLKDFKRRDESWGKYDSASIQNLNTPKLWTTIPSVMTSRLRNFRVISSS